MAVLHIDRVWLDGTRWIFLGQPLDLSPMGCGTAVVQQASFSEQEGTGTDLADSPGAACHGSEPGQEFLIALERGHVRSTADQERVDLVVKVTP